MNVTRRGVLQGMTAAGVAAMIPSGHALAEPAARPLDELRRDQVEVRGPLERDQQEQAAAVLLALDEDSLLKPFRRMRDTPSASASLGRPLGGWYDYRPDYDFHHDDDGFAPASTFGQWTSALSRLYACSRADGSAGNAALRERALRLHQMLRQEISAGYFAQTRFPAYSFDKLVCGLMDAHTMAGDTDAWEMLERVSALARPSLPGRAIERERQWTMGRDPSYMWDESYTMPENLYLAAAAGAGSGYRRMAREYLEDETFFLPLARGENSLSDRHAYSYTNALCSGMQAYLADGSDLHFRAVKNAFAMIEAQSFVTGGWGPDELFRKPGYQQLAASLTNTHNSFEGPCGSYAHTKLTRALLRSTRDGRYGDSMERVIHNVALGSLPMLPDGRAFYYADYNVMAKRIYSVHRWPCCSGTQPQLAADYGINGYLHEPGAVWVNLYQPSALRWTESGEPLVLEQTTDYPQNGRVELRLTAAARPVRFRLHLRLPAWTNGTATVAVNGVAVPFATRTGFTSIEREWKAGDSVTLTLPMSLRLEALPMDGGVMHLETVALLRGPQVLFAVRDPWESGALALPVDAMLAAEQTGESEWTVPTPTGPRHFVPWTGLGNRNYTTYVKAL